MSNRVFYEIIKIRSVNNNSHIYKFLNLVHPIYPGIYKYQKFCKSSNQTDMASQNISLINDLSSISNIRDSVLTFDFYEELNLREICGYHVFTYITYFCTESETQKSKLFCTDNSLNANILNYIRIKINHLLETCFFKDNEEQEGGLIFSLDELIYKNFIIVSRPYSNDNIRMLKSESINMMKSEYIKAFIIKI